MASPETTSAIPSTSGSLGGEAPREHWGSRIGLILAMAGNAVGLGNFLRFPAKAAANGGGAFMIPYFIAFLLLGIPLMWIEWGLGRYGGTIGHGTMPGIMHRMTKNRWAKYLGVLGIILSLLTAVYYNYIESWTLSFSYFSISGNFDRVQGKDISERKHQMGRFFNEYLGIPVTVKIVKTAPPLDVASVREMKDPDEVPETIKYDPKRDGEWDVFNGKLDQNKCPYLEVPLKRKYFDRLYIDYFFYLLTFVLNFYFLYRGLSAGIEQLGKIGMPVLFIFAIILAMRVLTMGQPEGSSWSVMDGLNFLWVPKFSELGNASVWLAAAGQIFFTLSLGQGAIHAYASYLSAKDDITLTGLATASLNEFAEVILGGTIAIPAAVAFFGPEMTTAIAKAGAFDLGFQTLPLIFSKITFGWFFGTIWFGLLFIAGITSSVALLTPPVTFLKDELKMEHHRAVMLVCGITFTLSHGCVFFTHRGVVDEMDYWVGTFGLVVFALMEVILFMWVFGGEKAWEEMHKGADMQIPRVFYYIMKYVTPVYILGLLFAWGIQDGWPILTMAAIPVLNRPFIWFTRFAMLIVVAVFLHFIWRRFGVEDGDSYWMPTIFWGCPMLVLIASYPGLLPIDTNALLFMTCSWMLVFGIAAFCIKTMISIPAKVHDDFPDETLPADKKN